jgi:hypothetical protein
MSAQQALALPLPAASNTVVINAHRESAPHRPFAASESARRVLAEFVT